MQQNKSFSEKDVGIYSNRVKEIGAHIAKFCSSEARGGGGGGIAFVWIFLGSTLMCMIFLIFSKNSSLKL